MKSDQEHGWGCTTTSTHLVRLEPATPVVFASRQDLSSRTMAMVKPAILRSIRQRTETKTYGHLQILDDFRIQCHEAHGRGALDEYMVLSAPIMLWREQLSMVILRTGDVNDAHIAEASLYAEKMGSWSINI